MSPVQKGFKNYCLFILSLAISFVLNAKSYNWSDISQEQYINNLVSCETQLQEYKWSKNLWPKANKTKKPAFSEVVDTDKIRQKILDNLYKQNLLSTQFNFDINHAMLQHDLDRMARNTKDAKGLKEMYKLFDNDAATIAQCLSRPYLVNSKLQNRYNQKTEIHQQSHKQAQLELNQYLLNNKTELSNAQINTVTFKIRQEEKDGEDLAKDPNEETIIELEEQEYQQKLNELDNTNLQEKNYAFIYTEILEQSNESIKVKNLVWQKQNINLWIETQQKVIQVTSYNNKHLTLTTITGSKNKFNKASTVIGDTWDNSLLPVKARYLHTAVWTGTEMIVWGGWDTINNFNTGGRYNPVTDSWISTSMVNAPEARRSLSAVWTGSEMIVWGGYGATPVNTGGRYDPSSDSWQSLNTTNIPPARYAHTAVWTGQEMIIWGGYDGSTKFNTGSRYNPSSDTWSDLPIAGAPIGRYAHTTVWTGSKMIVWGGFVNSAINDGGQYDLSTNTWSLTSTLNQPSSRYYHSAVWTGSKMIVWGGIGTSNHNTGGIYDSDNDMWTATSTTSVPNARRLHTAIWDDVNNQMIVWGGYSGSSNFNDGGKYNPTNNMWTPLTSTIGARQSHTAIWTGSEMIVWGGYNAGVVNTGGRYNPIGNSWNAVNNDNGVPTVRYVHTTVWTGAEMVIWGGFDGSNLNTGGRYNPNTDSWVSTSSNGSLPSARRTHTAVWTGIDMIVWGGYNGNGLNTGGRYNPISDSWAATSASGVPAGRYLHSAVWTGEMIVWGGYNGSSLNTGSRYNPSNDSWSATSTIGAPTPKREHTAIWTGTEMIVWGGSNGSDLNTGGRYNPSSDSWSATSTIGAPTARRLHTAVWTGTEMIVWGGYFNINTGGRYNPSSDSWATSSISGAPTGRFYHTTVWTGTEMIIWGGTGNTGETNTGGRYNPSSNSWSATSTIGAPTARRLHTTVWTGAEMIIWGGYGGGYLNSIGIYYPTNTHTIGGNLTGLNGNQVILQNNAGDDLTLSTNGAFTFANAITEGGSYVVTALTNPTSPAQTCTVTNGSGMNIMANVTNVQVTCVDNSHNINVTVTGLDATNSIEVTTNGQSLNFTGPGGPTNFTNPINAGTAYAVQVTANPTSPNQTCSVTGGDNSDGSGTIAGADVAIAVNCVTNQYSIGVTVNGLDGTVVLRNNGGDDLSITMDNSYVFATQIDDGASYAVTVLTQPTSPNQSCAVTGGDNSDGTGSLSGGDDLSIIVTCTTTKYTLGVTVSGLATGNNVILQNYSGDDLTISSNGVLTTFNTALDDLSNYAVSVLTNPTTPNQTCSVTGGDNGDGTGQINNGNDTSVVVTCVTNQYTVNVTVSGLAATNSITFANGGDTLPFSSNTTATLSTLNDGTAYNVLISGNQPDTPTQTCAFTNANTGTLSGANATVTVYCNTELTAVNDVYTAFEDITLVANDANASVVGVNDDGVLINDTDVDGDTLSVMNPGTTSATGLTGDVSIAANGTFSYVPPADVSGQDVLAIQVTDGIHTVPSNITIEVLPVNDAPTFTIMGNVLSAELHSNIVNTTLNITQFATNIDAGAPDESTQTLQFTATIFADSNSVLVTNGVSVTNTGDLTLDFTGNIGLAIIQLTLQDDGLTTNGGEDTSVVTEFVVSYSDVMFNDGFESTVLLKTQGLFTSKTFQISTKDSVIYQEATDSVKFSGHQLTLNGMDRIKALGLVKSWMRELLLIQEAL